MRIKRVKRIPNGEYEMTGDTVWLSVGNLSVYVRKHDDGVSVDLFPLGKEDEEALSGTWVSFNEASEE